MNVIILLQDQRKLETKAVIADFIEKTDFDDKLKKKKKLIKKFLQIKQNMYWLKMN